MSGCFKLTLHLRWPPSLYQGRILKGYKECDLKDTRMKPTTVPGTKKYELKKKITPQATRKHRMYIDISSDMY